MTRINPDYLRNTAESPTVHAIKVHAYELLGIGEGSSVVDVGCGPAIDTVPLARIVGPRGYVTGIDADLAMVDEANRRAAEAGTGTFTRHIQALATALPLPSAVADACFSERLLQHLPWNDAQRAVAEFVRIVRPQGRIVVIDTDWASLSIAAPDPLVERRVVHQHWYRFPNPFSGRLLPSMLARAGLTDVTTETYALPLSYGAAEFLLRPTIWAAVASGTLQWSDATRWWRGLHDLRDQGQFFAHVSIIVVSGNTAGRTDPSQRGHARVKAEPDRG